MGPGLFACNLVLYGGATDNPSPGLTTSLYLENSGFRKTLLNITIYEVNKEVSF